jgi:hypothetical protein
MSNLPELGSTVRVRNQRATVRYVGATDFAEGVWVGLELLRPVGRNDGSVHNIRYFTCEPECGLFVPPTHVIAIADTSAAPEPPKAEIASVWSNVESLQEGEALQAARKAERVMRHLSENYPKQGSTGDRRSARKKAQGKPGAARTGAARLDRQLSRDGDKGYEAVIEDMALAADYSGPSMAEDLTTQAHFHEAKRSTHSYLCS